MNYTFNNLVDHKTKEPLVMENVKIKEVEYYKKVGAECAKRVSIFFKKD